MKDFLILIFRFTLFFLIGYVLLFLVWVALMPVSLKPNLVYKLGHNGHLHSRIKELSNFNQLDLLILGSSYAYRNFDPREFETCGIHCFVLGSSAQTPLQSKILLQRYLGKLRPQKVVYAVNPKMFCIDGVESTLDLLANDPDNEGIWELAWHQKNIKVFNALLYKSLAQYHPSVKYYNEPVVKGFDTYISGGYVATSESKYQPGKYTNEPLAIREDQWVAFLDALAILKSQNIPVILVFPPVTNAYYNSLKEVSAFNVRLKMLGYPYFNYNEPCYYCKTEFFYDEQHMKASAVPSFNQDFIRKARLSEQ